MESKVLLIMDEFMTKHECPWPTYHIETPRRLEAIFDRLKKSGLTDHPNIITVAGQNGTEDDILTVHTRRYLEDIKGSQNMSVEEQEELCKSYEDIYVNKYTYKNALMAAGSAISLIDYVIENKSHGMALVRPPGHHASPDAGCGFCIFNNVAIAAKHASKKNKKALIVDFDVHAGQGTQECIEHDENIKLISMHRYENGTFWPNLEQGGVEHSFKNTINVPLNEINLNDADYLAIFTLIVLPIINDWRPDVIIVSCGFDAALGDPEGQMRVTPAGYAVMIRLLMNSGRSVAAILEGGYFIEGIGIDAEWVLRSMTGEDLPMYQKLPLSSVQCSVNRQVLDKYQNEFETFSNILKIAKHVRGISDEEWAVPAIKFLGERTVDVPYTTRGLYVPFSDEVVENFKVELNSIVSSYQNHNIENDSEKSISNAPSKFEFLIRILFTLSSNPSQKIEFSNELLNDEDFENFFTFFENNLKDCFTDVPLYKL